MTASLKTKRIVLLPIFLLALAALLPWAPAARAYDYFGAYNTATTPNTLVPIKYDLSKLPNSTLTYYLTASPQPSGFAMGDSVEVLMSEIALATSLWNGVSTSSLRVKFGGYTKQLPGTPLNPMGIVTFSASLPPGAAAVGGVLTGPASGNPPDFIPVALSRIQLPLDMSKTNTSSAFFLTVITHEMGHSLGTKHSHVAAAMFQTALTPRARVLTEDDIALISLLYPAPSFRSTTGSITGRVTTSAGPGASVVGVTAFSDSTVIGALTMPDGTFNISGLPPGNYKMSVQPLPLGAAPSSSADNPGDPDDLIDSRTLTGSIVPINTDIDSAFFAGGGAATHDPAAAAAFIVAAEQNTAGANVTIGSRGTLRLEVDDTFSFPSGNFGVGEIWVKQGGQIAAGADGRALDAAGLSLNFTNPGVSLASSRLLAGSGSGVFNVELQYLLQASPTAVAGSSTVIYANGSDTYFSPGQLRVVTSDPPKISSASPTSGTAGTAVAVSGANFNDTSHVYFDGVPATITSRSATSVVVVAPPGAGGHAANIFVANADGQGSEFLAAPPTFTYSTGPQQSLTASPLQAAAGQTLTVKITGTNTNFQQGLTSVGFGTGDIAVDSFSVDSSTSITAQIHLLPTESSRSFYITVMTGEEVVVLDGAAALGPQQPFQLVLVSGDRQTGTTGTALPQPLVVVAQGSNGVPVPGVTVNFTVVLGGGSVSPASVVTDSQGLARTNMTLGPITGTQIVTASAAQFSSTGIVEFGGSSASFGIGYNQSGNAQTGPVNAALPNALILQVGTSATGALPGIPVGWIVTSGGGSIKVVTSVTDSNGNVSATWTLGPTAGAQTVRAIPWFYNGTSLYGLNGATFTATGQGGTGTVTPNVPSGGVLNGAGFDSAVAGLSAGVIASIFGTNLSTAPASGVQPGFVPGTTTLQTTSNGTQVTFDGVAAPLFFVSPGQLNVQVPFEVTGKISVQMVVSLNGASSPPVAVAISAATPALFTLNSSGKGAAVALNQDGTLNGPNNPEAAGRVIQLFATGLGAVLPAAVTGQGARSTAPLSTSINNPTVAIGVVPAIMEFSGLAPGFVGLWQVNVRVPAGAGTGASALLLRAGGQNANPVTVFVQ